MLNNFGRRHQRGANRNGRRGFTLMELLLVMAILVIMASMVSFAFLNFRQNAMSDTTRSQIATLATACKMYKMDVGSFPSTLNDLIVMPSGLTRSQWRGPYMDMQTVPVDPWGNQYSYPQPDEVNNIVVITSAGADRQLGTADDVSTQRSK